MCLQKTSKLSGCWNFEVICFQNNLKNKLSLLDLLINSLGPIKETNSIVYRLSTKRNNYQSATKRHMLILLRKKQKQSLRLTAGDLQTKSPSISSKYSFLQTSNAPTERNSARTSRRRMFSDVGARVHTYTRRFTVPTRRPQWVFVRPSQTVLLRFVIMLMDYKESLIALRSRTFLSFLR